MNNENGYLVKDYTNSYNEGNPKIIIVSEDNVWDVLNDAKENELLITVFRIGDCLLDWSL